jgi:hypothetical protein
MEDGKNATNVATAQFKPKRIDIFKDENIVFDDENQYNTISKRGKANDQAANE